MPGAVFCRAVLTWCGARAMIKQLLVHGGGRDPLGMLRRVLGGRSPDVQSLLRAYGISQP